MLKIDHLTKRYGERIAVDDLSLQIRPGEICAFIGHNGAGQDDDAQGLLRDSPVRGGRNHRRRYLRPPRPARLQAPAHLHPR